MRQEWSGDEPIRTQDTPDPAPDTAPDAPVQPNGEVTAKPGTDTEDDPFAAFEEPLRRQKKETLLSPKKKKAIMLSLFIGLPVLLAALILLLTFVFPPEKEPDPASDTSDTTITVLDKSDGDALTIASATLQLGSDTTVEFVKKNDSLIVKKYEALPAHVGNIANLTQSLTVFTAIQDIGNIDDDAAFGFDKPRATGSVNYVDGSAFAFEVGDESPDQKGYYFREKGSAHTYVAPSDAVICMLLSPLDYISTSVFTEPDTGDAGDEAEVVLRNMSLGGTVRRDRNFSFRLVTSEDSESYMYYTYIITSPYTKGANSSYSTTLNAFTSLSAESVAAAYPTKEELAKFGLDDPFSVADFTLAVRTNVTSSSDASGNTEAVTKYSNLTNHTIRLGSMSGDYYYTMIDDVPIVYLVPSSQLPFATMQFEDLADKLLFMENITDLRSMTVTIPDSSTTFELTHHPDIDDKEKNLTVTANGKTYDTMDFRYLMQVFMGISRYQDLTSDITGKKKVCTLSLTRTGDSEPVFTANFYAMTSNLYAVVINNGERYQVRASEVENAIQQYRNYLDGKDVLY